MCSKVEPVSAIKVERQLAIRLGRKGGRVGAAEIGAQFEIVVDLAIGDQRCAPRFVERLIAGRKIDDGEQGLDHPDIPRSVSAIPIRTPVAQRLPHCAQRGRRRGRAVICHKPGDPAHQCVT